MAGGDWPGQTLSIALPVCVCYGSKGSNTMSHTASSQRFITENRSNWNVNELRHVSLWPGPGTEWRERGRGVATAFKACTHLQVNTGNQQTQPRDFQKKIQAFILGLYQRCRGDRKAVRAKSLPVTLKGMTFLWQRPVKSHMIMLKIRLKYN